MNNSNELSTRLIQSLPYEYKKAIEEFGAQYALFLNKYPTLQKRISSVPTVYDSVKNGGLSFVEIDKYFKDGASEWWIKTMVIDLFMVLGAFDVTTPYQFKAIAQRIRQEYYHVTPSELTRFFYEFSMGEYGEIYVGKTVNPQRLFIALEKYMCNVYEKRAEIDSQRNLDKQKIEYEKDKMNAISYEEYCLRKGVDPKESPLEELKQKLEKESKRNKDGISRKM
nr:MAG TPA: hypothetical protein [Caudoviricetes sp.]